MTELLETGWFVWGIGLIICFQVLVVLLGELIYRGNKHQLPLTHLYRSARNVVLPLFVIYLFQLKVIGLDPASTAVRVVATAFWISMVYASLRCINIVVFEQAPESSWRHRAPSLFRDLMRFLLIAIGAVTVLSIVWRQDLGAAMAALGIGSIVIGLALQETLGNLMAGIAILFERPFSIGDWISVGDDAGTVEQINWRSTHLRTREENLLIFPNSVLGRERFINYARPNSWCILRFSVAFKLDEPPTRVKNILISTARQMPEVLDEPAPNAYVMEVLDDRIRYEAFLYIDESQFIPQVSDSFFSRVWYMAKRENISLPLPTAIEYQNKQTDVNHDWSDTAHLLAKSEGFNVLSTDELESLARSCQIHTYGHGETLVESGDLSDSIWIIVSGEVVVDWEQAGVSVSLKLGKNNVIGNATMARDEARLAQICAIGGDVDVIRLHHETIKPLLQSHPRLAVEFSKIWEQRSHSLKRLYRDAESE